METNPPIQETSVINCKSCGETKTRILAGKYASGKDKRWVDENGKQFCGFLCPDCKRNKVKLEKRLKDEVKKLARKHA